MIEVIKLKVKYALHNGSISLDAEVEIPLPTIVRHLVLSGGKGHIESIKFIGTEQKDTIKLPDDWTNREDDPEDNDWVKENKEE